MTAFQSMILFSVGAPDTPAGGSSWTMISDEDDNYDHWSPEVSWSLSSVSSWLQWSWWWWYLALSDDLWLSVRSNDLIIYPEHSAHQLHSTLNRQSMSLSGLQCQQCQHYSSHSQLLSSDQLISQQQHQWVRLHFYISQTLFVAYQQTLHWNKTPLSWVSHVYNHIWRNPCRITIMLVLTKYMLCLTSWHIKIFVWSEHPPPALCPGLIWILPHWEIVN